MTSRERIVLLAVAAIYFTGCAVRTPHEDIGMFVDKSCIDLEPGWRSGS